MNAVSGGIVRTMSNKLSNIIIKYIPGCRRILRWLPVVLLILGFCLEGYMIFQVIKKPQFDILSVAGAIVVGFIVFTPPPILALAGYFVEDTKIFKVLNVCVIILGGILMLLFWLLCVVLVKKVIFDFTQGWMHGV